MLHSPQWIRCQTHGGVPLVSDDDDEKRGGGRGVVEGRGKNERRVCFDEM